MNYKYHGNIKDIRTIEDCIRATNQYTEGISNMWRRNKTQGGTTRVFTKYYEVYPGVHINWDMPAHTAIDLMWADVPIVDIKIFYDYRNNVAECTIRDTGHHSRNNGHKTAYELLIENIPGLEEAMACVGVNGNGHN